MSKPPLALALGAGLVLLGLAVLAFVAWTRGALPAGAARPLVDPPGPAAPRVEPEPAALSGAPPSREDAAIGALLEGGSPPAPLSSGPAVSGRVRERAAEPVAGAQVRLIATVAGEERLLVRGASDGEGAYHLSGARWERLDRGERAAAWLHVAVDAPGFLPARSAGRPLAAAGALLAFDEVLLDPGAAVRGRCLDAEGRPVEGAEVILLTPEPAADPRPYARARSDPDGGFRLALPEAGAAELLARHRELGATRRELEPHLHELGQAATGRAELDLGDLVLEGPGRLAGRVRHPDGTPAAAYELLAVPADLASRRAAAADLQGRVHADEGRGEPGLLIARALSDARGDFTISGLRPGRYALVHPGARSARRAALPIHATDREDLELVAPHPRVVVQVLLEGRPAPGARVRLQGLEWGGDDEIAFPTQQQADADGAGRVAFDVGPMARLALQASLAGHAPAELRLELSDGELERAVRLELEPAPEPARALVRLVDPRDGSPIPALAEVRSRVSGLVLARFRTGSEQELLPGAFRLELRPIPGRGPERFDLEQTVQADLELRAGERTALDVPARLGGRLLLDLAAPPPPAGPDLEPPAGLEAPELQRWRRELLRSAGLRARVELPHGLLDGAGEHVVLRFESAGSDPSTLFLPGPPGRLSETVLPAGTYALALEGPAYRELRVAVHVEEGRVSVVRLELAPR